MQGPRIDMADFQREYRRALAVRAAREGEPPSIWLAAFRREFLSHRLDEAWRHSMQWYLDQLGDA